MVRERGTERKVRTSGSGRNSTPKSKRTRTGGIVRTGKRQSHRKGHLEGNNDLPWDTASPHRRNHVENHGNKYSELVFLTAYDLPMATLAALCLKPEVTDAH